MKCQGCHGEVRNVPGRRHTIEDLTEIHRKTCPSRGRIVKDDETEEVEA